MSARSWLASAAIASAVSLPILVVLASLPSPGVLIASAHAAASRKAKSKKVAKDFTYTVSDCHPADELPSMRLDLSEDAVGWSQILNMNCIAATRPSTVKLDYARRGRELEVSIILRSPVLSDCTCPIGIDGRIGNIGKGSYRISFVYDGPPGKSASEPPVRRTVGSKDFSIE